MDDAITIPLIGAAWATHQAIAGGKFTPPAVRGIAGIGCKQVAGQRIIPPESSPSIQAEAASAWMRVQS